MDPTPEVPKLDGEVEIDMEVVESNLRAWGFNDQQVSSAVIREIRSRRRRILLQRILAEVACWGIIVGIAVLGFAVYYGLRVLERYMK